MNPYLITYDTWTEPQTINADGDTCRIRIAFTVNAEGTMNYSDTFVAQGIKVASWGELEWQYDFEDALLVPGTYRVKLFDMNGVLLNLFFGSTTTDVAKTAEVTVWINDDVVYVGMIQEDSISYDSDQKLISFSCEPNTLLLNQTRLYDDDSNPLNPLGYTDDYYYLVPQILEDCYQLVNSTISWPTSLNIYHDWELQGKREAPVADNHVYSDLMFTEIYQMIHPLFFDPTMGLTNIGDVLRKLAVDWCCYTGLIHSTRAFFKKLFYYDASNTQTLGNVKSRTFAYKYGLLDYVKMTTGTSAADVQVWEVGTDSHIDDRRLIRDVLPGWYSDAGGAPSWTNIKAVTARGAYPGTYFIVQGRDPGILAGAMQEKSATLLANFWYYNRHNLFRARVDKIVTSGVKYDFMKDFVDDGRKYQAVGMRINLSNNETTFEALYLGEAT